MHIQEMGKNPEAHEEALQCTYRRRERVQRGMRKHCNAQEIRKNPEAHEEALQCTGDKKEFRSA
jgi:hypothetical protein